MVPTPPRRLESAAIPSEETPLLATSGDNGPHTETPLPKVQILLLSLTRVTDPLAFAVLVPFVNAMVLSTHEVPVEEVGYYVGLIESLFAIAQTILLVHWGRAADKYGRKSVLLVSLVGSTMATVLFGFSTKIWQMMVARCLGGFFGGSAVVVRTLLAEASDSTNQARAFSFFAFASNVGLFLGPAIGGALSEPATHFPAVFGSITLFRDYPYALPCLITGAYHVVVLVLDVMFLKDSQQTTAVSGKEDASPPIRDLLTPDITKALLVYGFAALIGSAYTPVLPLFLFTPVPLGGLGFPPPHIATMFALAGLTQSLWMLFAMPPLDKKLGTYRLIRICYALWPWSFMLPVMANILAKKGHPVAAYSVVATMHSVGSGITMVFTSTQLIINNVAPPAYLGAVNGIALTIAFATRASMPAAFTALFAVGVEKNILGRYLVWAVLGAIAVVAYGVSGLTPRQNARKVIPEPGEEHVDAEEGIST